MIDEKSITRNRNQFYFLFPFFNFNIATSLDFPTISQTVAISKKSILTKLESCSLIYVNDLNIASSVSFVS